MFITLKGLWVHPNRFISNGITYDVIPYGLTIDTVILPLECYILLEGKIVRNYLEV